MLEKFNKSLAILWCFCMFSLYGDGPTEFERYMGKGTSHWIHVSKQEDVQILSQLEDLYQKNKHLRFTDWGPYKIPKVIHFVWLGPDPFPPASVENVRTWVAKHPDWTVKFWTDRDRFPPCSSMEVCDAHTFPFLFLRHCFEESNSWSEKADVLRFEILYQEGGLYVDHDAGCLQSFDGLHRGYHFYCGLQTPHPPIAGRNISSGLGLIGSSPFHPVIGRAIELIGSGWEGIGVKYRGRDIYSRVQLVRERTYIPLTYAIADRLGEDENIDIVFPAAYFFAKDEIPPLYSEHSFEKSWVLEDVKSSQVKKSTNRALSMLHRRSNLILWLGRGAISVNLLAFAGVFLYIYRKKKGKR